MNAWLVVVCLVGIPVMAPGDEAVQVDVPISRTGEIDLGDLVSVLAKATDVSVDRPPGGVRLPVGGLAGRLSRTMIGNVLGPLAHVDDEGQRLVVGVERAQLAPERLADWERRLRELAAQAEREARRQTRYGMHALGPYRPNDPARPTVCLVHGINSSSHGFVHMLRPLEEAGYGLVVFDYPFNRALDESIERFTRDWVAFRKERGEKRPWSIVAHSMGALVARGYVEGPKYADDVDVLALIAPVNQGSNLARTQTALQFLNGLEAVAVAQPSRDALASLGDGLGESAADMTPGSPFLARLNARPRRAGVTYHILAGDRGLIGAATRRRVEAELGALRHQGGILGGFARYVGGSALLGQLDEISDETGDGCVSVARTRLEGAGEPVVIHANHAELIRAPLLYPDEGPVACMPYLLRWLPRPASPR